MGLVKGSLEPLLKEASIRPFSGSLLTLGKQDVWFSYKTLCKMAQKHKVKLSNLNKIEISSNPYFAAHNYITDLCLFKALGFSELKSMDYSDYQGADIIFDLNSCEIPTALLGAFDVMLDGGTMEHVFHIPNVLNNIYKMLRVGGRIIHISPTSNYVDHGFFSFSPTLFYDFYQTNKFKIEILQICHIPYRYSVDPWQFFDYLPGCLDNVSLGGLNKNGMYGTICIATKMPDSSGNRIPQQGVYKLEWDKEKKKNSRDLFRRFFNYYRRFGIKNSLEKIYYQYRFLIKTLKRKYTRS